MHMHDAQVIIVGAGPVGLATALDLAHHGVRSLVLEKRSTPSVHARAAAILPHTLEILSTWGLLERFRAEGQWLTYLNLWRADTDKPLAHVSLEPLGRHSSAPAVVLLPQDRTEAILEEAALATGRVEIRRGHEVASVSQDPRCVQVGVHQEEGSAYEVQARYLVGCDGFHSTVRTAMGWELQGKTYPGRFLVADLRIDDARDALPGPRVRQFGGHLGVAMRIAPQLWRIMCPLRDGEVDELPGEVRRRAWGLLGPGPVQLLWQHAFVVHSRTSPRFAEGRVLLAGDAAHINSPVGGQGMNSGIADAHNLAWKLAYALRHRGDGPTLVASYDQERRTVIQRGIERSTDMLARLFTAQSLPRRVLGSVMRMLMGMDAVLNHMLPRMALLETHYDNSSLLMGAHPAVGQRVPDVLLEEAGGKSRTVHQRQGQQPILVIFDGPEGTRSATVARAAAQALHIAKVWRLLPPNCAPQGDGSMVERSGVLWKMCEAHPGAVALIRPDGHLGWVRHEAPGTVAATCAVIRQALGLRAPRRRMRNAGLGEESRAGPVSAPES